MREQYIYIYMIISKQKRDMKLEKTAKEGSVVLAMFTFCNLIAEKKGAGRIPVLESKN